LPTPPRDGYKQWKYIYGRFRAYIPSALFLATGDKSGHDLGDEDPGFAMARTVRH
jgi:hypothetical protein